MTVHAMYVTVFGIMWSGVVCFEENGGKDALFVSMVKLQVGFAFHLHFFFNLISHF